jgi:hypothetical protein
LSTTILLFLQIIVTSDTIYLKGIDSMPINTETHKYVPLNCPLDLYGQIKILAKNNERSISAQIIYMLKQQLKSK